MLSACRHQQRKVLHSCYRSLATEASVQPPSAVAFNPPLHTSKKNKAAITASVILNRSPFLTQTPTPFERAYYTYQARLRRALSNPFPNEFYFKQGSIIRTRFSLEEQARERFNFGPKYAKLTERQKKRFEADRLALEQIGPQEGEKEELMSRKHPADYTQDVKSLDRNGKRNMYLLLLANDEGQPTWRFPKGDVAKGELLHQAAQRDLELECGNTMDHWIVSKIPMGVYHPPLAETPTQEQITFFFKAHIMAGQVTRGRNVKDFAWLTKEEIESRVAKHYWEGVRDMLSDN